MNVIAKTEAYRTNGELFETEKQAKDYNRLLEYKEAIANNIKGELNDPSMGFLISLISSEDKRRNLRMLLDRIEKIDKNYE